MDIVYALAAFQGLIFTGFLIIRREQRLANQLLAAYLLFICFSLLTSYLRETGLLEQFPHLLGLDSGITYVCGPFLWFYALLVTRKITVLKWRDAWHLIPFILHYVYVYFVIIKEPEAFKLALIRGETSLSNPDFVLWSNGAKILHSFIYYAFIYRLISNWEKSVQQQKSMTKLVELKWLRWILMVILAISVVMTIWFVTYLVFHISIINGLMGALINVLLFVLVYAIVFFALRYPGLFKGQETEEKRTSHSQKYAQSTISNDESKIHWQKVASYMEASKPYLKANLTIADLAQVLDLPVKTLSQTINENSGKNFFNFINQYRVEEFKVRAADPSNGHLTLLAIALDCGFASRSSFHAIFKKLENCTPKQYINGLKPSLQPQ
ncbi:MAG: helix-turn-helix transcriptional regulator [Roseivirga sp.]|nr:helix-turn-helix transcriptional regulator [Roseivirga sp.]